MPPCTAPSRAVVCSVRPLRSSQRCASDQTRAFVSPISSSPAWGHSEGAGAPAWTWPLPTVRQSPSLPDRKVFGVDRRGPQYLRPSIIALERPTAYFCAEWQKYLARIQRKYDKYQPSFWLQDRKLPKFPPRVKGWIEKTLSLMERPPVPLSLLQDSLGTNGREAWKWTALWLASHQPDHLLDFIMATSVIPHPPINWIEDCLQFLAQYYSFNPTLTPDGRAAKLSHLADSFLVLLQRDNEHYWFNSSFLSLLMKHCSERHISALWQVFIDGRIQAKFSQHVYLNFAHHFALHGQLDNSLDAALRARAAGCRPQSLAFRMGCASLLRKAINHQDGLRYSVGIIEILIDAGLTLDRLMYNIIMLNAIDSGDSQTAESVHRAAIEKGFQPDAYTRAIQLKACKADINNGEKLREVIRASVTQGMARENAVVATEILHCLALHHTFVNPKGAFGAIMEAYAQLFDTAPLTRLQIPFPDDISADVSGPRRPSPTPQAIGMVITGLLMAHSDYGPDIGARVYAQWRRQVQAKDPVLSELALNTHMSNIFIKHFLRTRRGLLLATQVIKDMQEKLYIRPDVRQAEPDLWTWSILLDGFAKRGEAHLAEQVKEHMEAKGIEPNHVTWNTLVDAYVRAEDTEGMLNTLRRMNAKGVAMSEWTYGHLNRVKDKERLEEVLRSVA
ncbi:hypothetical protein K470DRAFT_53919 [Piedraia hortae CBS 480.64]|uniref:Pentacotripeptide-repeat region of PRORP domain-containing protein n=1 Tax=Piedraia hortae CBS 480.64 TaxID=1314780 RepID=A0A6A7C9M9_9PEZI|nr:hypothetical protein K470DRAFT_53919 [Piedraia hortae CBS 480.64]